jgi:UDP-glucose 4-epimerase
MASAFYSHSEAVLVTGGAGYIGSMACHSLLDAGHQVIVLDNFSTGAAEAVPAGVTLIRGDVRDAALVSEAIHRFGVRSVMHFAGSIVVPESIVDPAKYYLNNTFATLEMARACIATGVHEFIFSSTAAVYGAVDIGAPVDEATTTTPINPYGASKLYAESMLLDLARADQAFRPVILRYFNVGGADPLLRTGSRKKDATHLINMALLAKSGDKEALEIYGVDYPTRDGTCERDYIHVADLADAHICALDYLRAGGRADIFNVGYGRGYTVREVISAFSTGSDLPFKVVEQPRRDGDPASVVADSAKIRRELGWMPRYEGLARIVRDASAWQEKSRPREPGHAIMGTQLGKV